MAHLRLEKETREKLLEYVLLDAGPFKIREGEVSIMSIIIIMALEIILLSPPPRRVTRFFLIVFLLLAFRSSHSLFQEIGSVWRGRLRPGRCHHCRDAQSRKAPDLRRCQQRARQGQARRPTVRQRPRVRPREIAGGNARHVARSWRRDRVPLPPREPLHRQVHREGLWPEARGNGYDVRDKHLQIFSRRALHEERYWSGRVAGCCRTFLTRPSSAQLKHIHLLVYFSDLLRRCPHRLGGSGQRNCPFLPVVPARPEVEVWRPIPAAVLHHRQEPGGTRCHRHRLP